ncbi:MAG: globin domain-containing protein [Methylophilaceae bacterium]
MLSSAAKPYIDASVPVLREHGLTITSVFYKNMLRDHPELNNLFNLGNQANGSQQQSLASAVFAYAANIENAAALAPVIERIVHKHVSIGILPSHYPIVGKYLLGAIKEVLGEAATPDLIAAWDEAYGLLADALIAAEARLYQANDGIDHQWLSMKVIKKEHVTDDIFSMTLRLNDVNAKLPSFKPGQYISFSAHIDALGLQQIRQYSLSDADNGTTYRVTIKREKGDEYKPQGTFSNWMHQHARIGSVLKVSHPYGTFAPDVSKQTPIALISAGVGVTPMISIFNTLAKQNSKRNILFAYAARSKDHLVHYDEVVAASKQLEQAKVLVYLNEKNEEGFMHGMMDLTPVIGSNFADTEYCLCGPLAFMNDQWKTLLELGVSPHHIHREVFGPESLNHLI